jgi:hypothetical protein
MICYNIYTSACGNTTGMLGLEKSSCPPTCQYRKPFARIQGRSDMFRIPRLVIVLGLLLTMLLASCIAPAKPRTFENDAFSFTIPADWKTSEEVWDRPHSSGQEYYGLGVQELVTIQYPTIPGKGKAFFAVASSQMQDGQDLESRFNQAYQNATPKIQDTVKQSFEQGGLSGYEISYNRPWGEPWWKFRDIWLEKDNVIYVLSFHAPPNSFETYNDTFEKILENFQFKD